MLHDFCWVDVATPDAQGALAFYGQLFDWTSTVSQGAMGDYHILKYQDRRVGGLMEMKEHSHWTNYIQVENVDVSAGRAAELGGKVCMAPIDVGDTGRMAMILDPTGASFCIWQVKGDGEETLREVPHANCWQELMTSDTARAQEFYSQFLGWTAHPEKFGTLDYTTFKSGEKSVGGMMAKPASLAQFPDHWNTYFQVEDCEAAVARATELGGTCLDGPHDVPTVGRFAVIRDPQGAHFILIKLAS